MIAPESIASATGVRRVHALINPRSGFNLVPGLVASVLRDIWEGDGIKFSCQESESPEDGMAKARRAVEEGVDTLLVAGGDGMVNTIGAQLIGTPVAMAVIPTGSGNGFARHFGIPMGARKSALALRSGIRRKIDVGVAAQRPFFVTCGLAWEADVVKAFQKLPIRGVPSYIFAGISQYFTYIPQIFQLSLDGDALEVVHPLVLTVANLTQYGGGARIAPGAKSDDGLLKLIVVPKSDMIRQITQFYHMLDGKLPEMPEVTTRSFQVMTVERDRPDPIQVDGELLPADRTFTIKVLPAALEVIVPSKPEPAV
jgi:diacylglycerol kinase (ATP)